MNTKAERWTQGFFIQVQGFLIKPRGFFIQSRGFCIQFRGFFHPIPRVFHSIPRVFHSIPRVFHSILRVFHSIPRVFFLLILIFLWVNVVQFQKSGFNLDLHKLVLSYAEFDENCCILKTLIFTKIIIFYSWINATSAPTSKQLQ